MKCYKTYTTDTDYSENIHFRLENLAQEIGDLECRGPATDFDGNIIDVYTNDKNIEMWLLRLVCLRKHNMVNDGSSFSLLRGYVNVKN